MKRLLAFLLAAVTLLSLVSCSSGISADEPTAEETKTEVKTEKKTEKEEIVLETGPITLPQGFSVGYARVDIISRRTSICPPRRPVATRAVNCLATFPSNFTFWSLI